MGKGSNDTRKGGLRPHKNATTQSKFGRDLSLEVDDWEEMIDHITNKDVESIINRLQTNRVVVTDINDNKFVISKNRDYSYSFVPTSMDKNNGIKQDFTLTPSELNMFGKEEDRAGLMRKWLIDNLHEVREIKSYH